MSQDIPQDISTSLNSGHKMVVIGANDSAMGPYRVAGADRHDFMNVGQVLRAKDLGARNVEFVVVNGRIPTEAMNNLVYMVEHSPNTRAIYVTSNGGALNHMMEKFSLSMRSKGVVAVDIPDVTRVIELKPEPQGRVVESPPNPPAPPPKPPAPSPPPPAAAAAAGAANNGRVVVELSPDPHPLQPPIKPAGPLPGVQSAGSPPAQAEPVPEGPSEKPDQNGPSAPPPKPPEPTDAPQSDHPRRLSLQENLDQLEQLYDRFGCDYNRVISYFREMGFDDSKLSYKALYQRLLAIRHRRGHLSGKGSEHNGNVDALAALQSSGKGHELLDAIAAARTSQEHILKLAAEVAAENEHLKALSAEQADQLKQALAKQAEQAKELLDLHTETEDLRGKVAHVLDVFKPKPKAVHQ